MISVEFFFTRKWVAAISRDNVCLSWQTLGSMANVNACIATQLQPQNIPFTIRPRETE